MANALLRPSVVEFVEITHPRVGRGGRPRGGADRSGQPPRVGLTVRALEQRVPRLRVVGLKRSDARMEPVPDEEPRRWRPATSWW